MAVEIISCSVSTKVWDWAGIELATPGSAVGRITDYALFPGPNYTCKCMYNCIYYNRHFRTTPRMSLKSHLITDQCNDNLACDIVTQLKSHLFSLPHLIPLIQEGLLSVTSESMCTKFWLTTYSSLPRKKCG